MIEDRLRPRGSSSTSPHLYRAHYMQRTDHPVHAGGNSLRTSPQQRKARAIIKKYRKTVRYAQLYNLKCLVPAVRETKDATEVDILEETVRYIEQLEHKLLSQVQSIGLPSKLAKQDVKDLPEKSTKSETSENGAAAGESGLRIEDLRNLVHKSLQPELHQKLMKQRRQDQLNIQTLLSEASSSQASSSESNSSKKSSD